MKSEEDLNREIHKITMRIRYFSPRFRHSLGDGPEPNPTLESILTYNKYLNKYLKTLKKILKMYKDEYRDKYFS